jgi:hypothetical protein
MPSTKSEDYEYAELFVDWAFQVAHVMRVGGCSNQLRGGRDERDGGRRFGHASSNTGDVGFAWVQGGAILAAASFNNHGGTNTVTTIATGSYRVDFPNLGGPGGHVQVTAIGTPPTSHGGAWGYCKVRSWGPNGTTMQVFVDCRTPGGTLQPLGFTVAFQRRSGSVPSAEAAYAWADQPTAASYTPSSLYQWSSGGGSVTIVRESVDTYRVSFPGQAATGHRVIEATAYGSDSAYCSPGDGNTNTETRVRCFAPSGALNDALFTVAFSRQSPNDGLLYGGLFDDAGNLLLTSGEPAVRD